MRQLYWETVMRPIVDFACTRPEIDGMRRSAAPRRWSASPPPRARMGTARDGTGRDSTSRSSTGSTTPCT
jgi:hypothetical protein